jgi:hypothetical protein
MGTGLFPFVYVTDIRVTNTPEFPVLVHKVWELLGQCFQLVTLLRGLRNQPVRSASTFSFFSGKGVEWRKYPGEARAHGLV